VQTIRQLEAVLHQDWQQLSQQDIRRLTGGMRRRVKAIIQAHGVTPVLNFEQYMSLSDSQVTLWKWNDNLIVLFELWRSILKMDMFYRKNWSCDIVIKYSLN
jgi:hypothetical protein